ncbi:hypothetical protein [Sphingomonas palmae]|uniref:hypothetical protein n=1 Tax=Sphingomonas palmae TaxID=1855283 RepID=UPI00115F91BB|nr:hypothetical protein [Sphingomonas palmae]
MSFSALLSSDPINTRTVAQAVYTPRQVIELAGILEKGNVGFCDLYESLNLGFGRDTNVAYALAMMVFSSAAKAGFPMNMVSKPASSLILHGLKQLMGDATKWKNTEGHQPEKSVQQWFEENGAQHQARQAYQLLGLHERVTNRFMAFDGRCVFAAEDANRLFDGVQRATLSVLDVVPIVHRLSNYRQGPLFTLQKK